MRNKVLSILILIIMLAGAACTTPATEVPPTATPAAVSTEVPHTPTAVPPTATAIPPTTTPKPVTLTVMAAASLTETFTELGKMFEAGNPWVTVNFNFSNGQTLAAQLAQGAPADVFASASIKHMDAAVGSKRVDADAARAFATNRLVVVFPRENPGAIMQLQDLAKEELVLVLGDKATSVGQYSLDFLDKAAADPNFDPGFKDAVLANVVSYENTVKSVLAKVTLDEADAGIVFITDITPDVVELVDTLEIPDELNTIAIYPIAPINDSASPEMARAFVDFVLSPDGQAVMAKYGFIPVSEAVKTP